MAVAVELPRCFVDGETTEATFETTTDKLIQASVRSLTSPQGTFNLLGDQFQVGPLNTEDDFHLPTSTVIMR